MDLKLKPAIDLFMQQQGNQVVFDEEIFNHVEQVYVTVSHTASVLTDGDWERVYYF